MTGPLALAAGAAIAPATHSAASIHQASDHQVGQDAGELLVGHLKEFVKNLHGWGTGQATIGDLADAFRQCEAALAAYRFCGESVFARMAGEFRAVFGRVILVLEFEEDKDGGAGDDESGQLEDMLQQLYGIVIEMIRFANSKKEEMKAAAELASGRSLDGSLDVKQVANAQGRVRDGAGTPPAKVQRDRSNIDQRDRIPSNGSPCKENDLITGDAKSSTVSPTPSRSLVSAAEPRDFAPLTEAGAARLPQTRKIAAATATATTTNAAASIIAANLTSQDSFATRILDMKRRAISGNAMTIGSHVIVAAAASATRADQLLREEIHALKAQVSMQRKEKSELVDLVTALRSEVRASTNHEQLINAFSAQFRELKQELHASTSFKDEFESLRSEMAEIKTSLGSSATSSTANTATTCDEHTTTITRLQDQVNAAKARTAEQTHALKSTQETISKIKGGATLLKRDVTAFIERTRNEIQQLAAAGKQSETEANGFKSCYSPEILAKRQYLRGYYSVSGKQSTAAAAHGDLAEMEEMIKNMTHDMTQKQAQPTPTRMAYVERKCRTVEQSILQIQTRVQETTPVWKKTWELELQQIVGEQQALKDEEAAVQECAQQHARVAEMLQRLRTLVAARAESAPATVIVDSAHADDVAAELPKMLREIKMAVVPDSGRRLRAIAEASRRRQWECENRVDEFAQELADAVNAPRLRDNRGVAALERARSEVEREALRIMYQSK